MLRRMFAGGLLCSVAFGITLRHLFQTQVR
jgi:hypothetical protein